MGADSPSRWSTYQKSFWLDTENANSYDLPRHEFIYQAPAKIYTNE